VTGVQTCALPISPTTNFIHFIPTGSKILAVQAQAEDTIAMWVEVTPEAPKITRMFEIYMTGKKLTINI
jgi:hypothetical protein